MSDSRVMDGKLMADIHLTALLWQLKSSWMPLFVEAFFYCFLRTRYGAASLVFYCLAPEKKYLIKLSHYVFIIFSHLFFIL